MDLSLETYISIELFIMHQAKSIRCVYFLEGRKRKWKETPQNQDESSHICWIAQQNTRSALEYSGEKLKSKIKFFWNVLSSEILFLGQLIDRRLALRLFEYMKIYKNSISSFSAKVKAPSTSPITVKHKVCIQW